MAIPGVCVISPRGQMDYNDLYNMIEYANVKTVKFHMPAGFSTDPIDVENAIHLGVENIILRTDDGLAGYDYAKVRNDFERPGGISNYSYASLLDRYPHVNWWIEIGNEPNLHGINGWSARWWALALYKELALNHLGHIDQPWRSKYRNLHWTVSLPTKFSEAENMLVWQNNHGRDNLGDGSIIDYYDAISCHLYGDKNVLSFNYDWPAIYEMLLENKYVRRIHITEMGINDEFISMHTKCDMYNEFIKTAHKKVDLCTVWFLGIDPEFAHYQITNKNDLRMLIEGY
jgi:hypothetical protein